MESERESWLAIKRLNFKSILSTVEFKSTVYIMWSSVPKSLHTLLFTCFSYIIFLPCSLISLPSPRGWAKNWLMRNRVRVTDKLEAVVRVWVLRTKSRVRKAREEYESWVERAGKKGGFPEGKMPRGTERPCGDAGTLWAPLHTICDCEAAPAPSAPTERKR